MLQMTNRVQKRAAQALLVLEPVRWQLGLQSLLIRPGQNTLGSADDCTLQVRADGVLPRHCAIDAGPDRTILFADNDRTWQNDGPVKDSRIHPGDRLAIGPVEFHVRTATLEEVLEFLPDECDEVAIDAANDPAATLPGPTRANSSASRPETERGRPETPPASASEPESAPQVAPDLARAQASLSMESALLRDQWNRMDVRERALNAQRRELEDWERRIHDGRAAWNSEKDGAAEANELKMRELLEFEARLNVRQAELDSEESAREARQMEAARAAVQSERESLDLLRASLRDREKELLAAAEDFAETQAMLSKDRQELNRERETLAHERNQLKQHRRELAGSQKDVASSRKRLEEELHRFFADREQLEETQQALEETKRQIELDRQKLNAEIERQAVRESARDQSRQCPVENIDGFSELQAKLVNDQQELNRERESLARARDQLERDRREIAKTQKEVAKASEQLEVELTRFFAEREEFETRQESLENERKQLEADQKKIEAEIARLDERESSLQEKQSASQDGSEENQQRLEADRQSLEAERANVGRQRSELEDQRAKLAEDRVECEGKLAELKNRAEKIREESERLESVREELNSTRKQLDCRQDELELRIRAWESESSQAAKTRWQHEERLAEFDGRLKTAEGYLLAAEEQYESSITRLTQHEIELYQCLRDLEEAQEEFLEQQLLLEAERAERSGQQSGENNEDVAEPPEQFAAGHALLEERERQIEQLMEEFRAAEIAWETSRQTAADEKKAMNEARLQLEADREAVRRLNEQLVGDAEDLERRERELAENLAALERERDQLQESLEARASENAEPAGQEADLETQPEPSSSETQLEAREVADWLVEIEQTTLELSQKRASLEAEAEELEKQRAEIDSERAELDSRRQELAEFERETEELQKKLADRAADVEAANLEMETQRQTPTERDRELAPQDTTVSDEHTVVEEIQDSAADWKKQQEEIAAARQALESERAEQEAARRELEERGKEIEQLLADFQSERSAVEQEREAVRKQQEELERLRAELQQAASGLPIQRTLDQEGQEAGSPDSKDPEVDALRSTLAAMFEIQESEIARREAVARAEAEAAAADSPSQDSAGDGVGDEAAQPETTASEPEASVCVDEKDEELQDLVASQDPDSVENYMERLFARNRRGGPAVAPAVRTRPAPSKSEKAAKSEPEPAAEGTVAQEKAAMKKQKKAAAESAKREQPSKEELRADIDSFREIANLSARSAVAKHSWKKLRGKIAVSAVLTVLAFSVAAILCTGLLGPRLHHPQFGGISAVFGAILGIDFSRSVTKMLLQKARAKKPKVERSAKTENGPSA